MSSQFACGHVINPSCLIILKMEYRIDKCKRCETTIEQTTNAQKQKKNKNTIKTAYFN